MDPNCPTSASSEYARLLAACGGIPGAGGPGGAQPIYPAFPNGYGCPADCIGMHWVGGFVADGIAAGAAAFEIITKPAVKSQLARLFIPEDVVNNFRGVDFVIGVQPVFLNKKPFSLAGWLPNSKCGDIRRIVWGESVDATLTVRNKTAAPADFEASGIAYMLAGAQV